MEEFFFFFNFTGTAFHVRRHKADIQKHYIYFQWKILQTIKFPLTYLSAFAWTDKKIGKLLEETMAQDTPHAMAEFR